VPRVKVEICCASVEDALAAEEGGADRVELCAALCVGGLTPSAGAILEAKARVRIPVMVMIRPRAAGFRYRDREIAVMERDIAQAVTAGADGVVMGALTEDGTIDVATCRRLRARAGDVQAVFHRAFDLVPDPFSALEQLVALGFTRVLTSGQRPSAAEGAPLLKRLGEAAKDRIEVLAGGGIRPHNVGALVAETGCRQVHLSAFSTLGDPSTNAHPELSFLGDHAPPGQYARTDVEKVRDLVRAVSFSS
jgi:copper homeostasis protein